MAPASYQPPKRGDSDSSTTYSQSTESNQAAETATVRKLLDQKGHDILAVRPQDSIAKAVEILREKRIGAVVVSDANGDLQGILSERDVVRRLAKSAEKTLPLAVEEIMTKDVVTCGPDDLLVTVLQQMTEGRFRHMPVMDGTHLAGILTIGDVVNYRLKELEHQALQLKQLIVG